MFHPCDFIYQNPHEKLHTLKHDHMNVNVSHNTTATQWLSFNSSIRVFSINLNLRSLVRKVIRSCRQGFFFFFKYKTHCKPNDIFEAAHYVESFSNMNYVFKCKDCWDITGALFLGNWPKWKSIRFPKMVINTIVNSKFADFFKLSNVFHNLSLVTLRGRSTFRLQKRTL